MAAPGQPMRPVLACGEVRTCLLPSFRALDGRAAAQLLRLRADEHVRVSERPNLYVRSPEVLTGVDCRLPTSNGAKVRAVGTVAARAALTEGRVLQATAYFSAPASGPEMRRPWGEYLVRPGVVEPFGKLSEQVTAEGILRGPGRGELNLGMIAEGLLAQLRRHPLLDCKPPFKSRPTHLRWAALRASEGQGPTWEGFTLAKEGLRTVELRLPEDIPVTAAAGLCEDLALHDWLLTTVVHMLDRSRLGEPDGTSAALALRPAVDHLLHLWMPRAHVDPSLGHLWDVLEQAPGFTRQWQNLAQRIRDQLAAQAVPLRDVRHVRDQRRFPQMRNERVTRLARAYTQVEEHGSDIVKTFAQGEMARLASLMESLSNGSADCPGASREPGSGQAVSAEDRDQGEAGPAGA